MAVQTYNHLMMTISRGYQICTYMKLVFCLTYLLFFFSFGYFLLLQLWPFANGWLLDKPYENEVTLKGQNIPLRCC